MTESLTTIQSGDLPPLAYSHDDSHKQWLTRPECFRPVTNQGAWVKPSGGLWTAPVTARAVDGAITGTSWTDWCASEDWGVEVYTRFLAVVPLASARVLLVDTLDDLRLLVREFPNANPGYGREYPDWARMAESWDAVYLTDAGQWATRLPPRDEPNLYGWDCASVLWLQPAYSVDVPALSSAAEAVTQ